MRICAVLAEAILALQQSADIMPVVVSFIVGGVVMEMSVLMLSCLNESSPHP